MASKHGRLLVVAAVAGLVYLPTWLAVQWQSILLGGSAVVINLAFLWLGFNKLWRNRDDLQHLSASGDDRLAGHFLILGGAFWLPFSHYSTSLQSLTWILVLIGVAWSSFGITFFRRYAAASLMILIGMYPNSTFLFNRMLDALIEPAFFERLVAWLGGQGLWLIGQDASSNGSYIILADKTALVMYGCTGIDMAVSLAGLSLVVGLVFKQSVWRILLAVTTGIFIAMAFNIPRVMLMVMALAYWGQESFEFWHGNWGGQIFSAIMFTVAYYAIGPLYSQKPQTKRA